MGMYPAWAPTGPAAELGWGLGDGDGRAAPGPAVSPHGVVSLSTPGAPSHLPENTLKSQCQPCNLRPLTSLGLSFPASVNGGTSTASLLGGN